MLHTLPLLMILSQTLAASTTAQVGWEHRDFQDVVYESSAAPVFGALVDGDGTDLVGGVSLSFGVRYVPWASVITTSDSYVLEPMFGDHFGFDVNVHGLARDNGRIWMLGVDPVLSNILGDSTAKGRIQLSSAVDVLLPEIGFAIRHDGGDSSPYLGWHFNARALLSPHTALSARAGVQVLFVDQAEALATVSVGLTYR